jgi:uncharacterized protein YndB with AHSA1/START domain
MNPVPDTIEKHAVLHAPRERVWRAISEARQFGAWFGVEFDGEFEAGTRLVGKIVPTQADPEVAKLQEPYTGFPFEFFVEQIEPMRLFAFRWHPFAVDRDADYSDESMTLIEFWLDDAGEETRLTIRESGFDHIPLARRAQAYAANEGGWTHQMRLVEKFLGMFPA